MATQSQSDGAPLRLRLANRRMLLWHRVDVVLAGADQPIPLHVGAGYDLPYDYRTGALELEAVPIVREVWVRGRHKVGSELDRALDDEATALSLLLQCGYTPRGLRDRFGAADHDGRPVTVIAAVLDELIVMQEELRNEWLEFQKARGA